VESGWLKLNTKIVKNMKLVIAEKPDAARKMASFLGAKTNQSGYIEGAGYIFTWGFGHLAELCPPEAYGFSEKWRMDELPMLPAAFKIQAAADKVAQVKLIKSLIAKKEVDSIINACDPDREGELIFRYIMDLAGGAAVHKPMQRVWLSTFTEADVKKAFSSPVPAGQYDNLGAAGRARSEADWLVGMNGTRAMTLKTGNMVSIGRVQTPTLAIICNRYLSNKNFKPVPYYTVRLTLEKDGIQFTATTKRIDDKIRAEATKNKVAGTSVEVAEIEKKERVENPPLLLDLTELQKEANKRYGLTAAETDAVAQKLYEAGIMSYPRTDSRFIGENMFAEIPKFLELCTGLNQDFHTAHAKYTGVALNDNCVNDKKVTGHHALLPTLEAVVNKVAALSETERKVFYLVIRRMYEAFYIPCKKDITNVVFSAGDAETFHAKGALVKEAGWRGLFKEIPDTDEEASEQPEQEQQLPALRAQETLPVQKADLLENKTKPEPLFTESSLISYMKTCGKELDDDALKKVLTNVEGIGRPATRSGIIETLIRRKFITREKGKIIPTLLGLAIYNLVKTMKVAQVLLTAEWEAKLDRIAQGEFSYEEFMREIGAYIHSIVNEVKALVETEAVNQAADADKILCPKCRKAHLRIFEKGIGCSNKECGFVLWRSLCKKNLTDNQLNEIAKGKVTGTIKGFVSPKTGKAFEAKLKMKADFTGIEFVFQNKK
jgi:DNA topoisomerase-3